MKSVFMWVGGCVCYLNSSVFTPVNTYMTTNQNLVSTPCGHVVKEKVGICIIQPSIYNGEETFTSAGDLLKTTQIIFIGSS